MSDLGFSDFVLLFLFSIIGMGGGALFFFGPMMASRSLTKSEERQQMGGCGALIVAMAIFLWGITELFS